MKCWFCSTRYTKRHNCPRLICYRVLKRFLLITVYDYKPTNPEELLKYAMERVEREKLFSFSEDIESVFLEFIPFFCDEFDLC